MAPTPNTSVDQTFDALHHLAGSPGPVGPADLARALDLSMSTAHRLLVTLHDSGFAERDTTGAKYELGARAHQLVHGLFQQFGLHQAASPVLRRLAELTGQTSVLDLRVGWFSVRAAGVEGGREIHSGTGLGRMEPLGASVPGRALLAALETGETARYRRWVDGQGVGIRSNGAAVPPVREIRLVGTMGPVVLTTEAVTGAGPVAAVTRVVRHRERVVGAVSLLGPGPVLDPGAVPDVLSGVADALAGLDALLEERPQLARDPFACLDPDAVAGPATVWSRP